MDAAWDSMTGEQHDRWTTVLHHLAAAIPPGTPSVTVDGTDWRTALLAERLAATLCQTGRPCPRLIHTGGAVTIWIRSAPQDANGGHRGDDAHIVVDLHDPAWPVIRHLDGRFAPNDSWYQSETRAFFASRAATWDTKFGDDLPADAAAVARAAMPPGGVVVDVGCGTGRALAALRSAVGASGTVLGIELTPQMLAVAQTRATASNAPLILADARRLPIADETADAVFAAGLVMHPAARHGRTLQPDEPLAEAPLRHTPPSAPAGTSRPTTTHHTGFSPSPPASKQPRPRRPPTGGVRVMPYGCR